MTVVLEKTTSHLEYFCDDSNIENLVLNSCTTRDINTLFRKLRPRLQGGETVKPLPRLKRVILGHEVQNENTMTRLRTLAPSYSTTLVEILEQRLDRSNSSFTVETDLTGFGWTPDTQARLRELNSKGYDIQFIDRFEDSEDDF